MLSAQVSVELSIELVLKEAAAGRELDVQLLQAMHGAAQSQQHQMLCLLRCTVF